MNRHLILKSCYALTPLILLLGVWQLVGSSSPRMHFLYGTPWAVLMTLMSELGRPTFWTDIGITLAEVVGGLILGNVSGTGLALLLWRYQSVGEISKPYVLALSTIPIFAVMPIFILWFGIGFSAKLAIITFSTTFVALANALAGATAVGAQYHEMICSLGGTRSDLLRKAVFPGTIALSFVAYRMNVSFALIGAYIAEWVSAERGLGQYILRATNLYDVPRVWAGLTVFLSIGFLLHAATTAIERRMFRSENEWNSRL